MKASKVATPSAKCAKSKWRETRGFTLVEIGVASLIIGVMAAIAVPQVKKSIITARSETVINDLRVFSNAFEQYVQEKGDWPPNRDVPGAYPTGMEGYLRESSWARKTPIGGHYNWQSGVQQAGQRVRAAITISASDDENPVSSDRRQLEDIDRRIDDGDLATGIFRLGFGNEPIYVIER